MALPNLPPGLQARCDAIVADTLAALATAQEAYKAERPGDPDEMGNPPPERGKYAQCFRSHAALPKDGKAAAPDNTKAWTALGVTLPVGMECATEVHEYVGPAGVGYVLFASIEIAGETWQRVVNVGPAAEDYRTRDWTKVDS